MKIIDQISKKIANKETFFSLEFFPPKDSADWPSFFSVVEKLRDINPLFASVTYGAGGGTQNTTLDITARLNREGILPMAHLTCVEATSERLFSYLTRMQDAGITNILALRGDAPTKNSTFQWEDGEFIYASDLAAFVGKKFPDFGIAAAAYPTPHPESTSFSRDREYTAQKLKLCDFAITQVFFDAREYFEHVEQMRLLGVTKPIIPGILPVQSLESLKRVLSLSGCTIPAKMYLEFEKAHEKGGAKAVNEVGITFAVNQIAQLIKGGAPGIHLYTLNRAETCLSIAKNF